jgi:hypothetical protein
LISVANGFATLLSTSSRTFLSDIS